MHEPRLASTARPSPRRRLVLCLDGTWNSAERLTARKDGTHVIKPTNVLKLARAVKPLDADGIPQLTLYHSGVGSMGVYPGLSNRMLELTDRLVGGLTGAGYEAELEGPLTFLVNNYRPGDEVWVFGFSRGAAQARTLTRFIDWMGGMPHKSDAYYVPLMYRDYMYSRGTASARDVRTDRGEGPERPFEPIRIRLLGVWDTVLAHGGDFLVGVEPASCVEHARHAMAADERRYTFLPSVWTAAPAGVDMEQRWFAGAHSNVGGGYLEDGLANVAFRWMLREAETLGLEVDEGYVRHYGAYPQGRLYDSKTLRFKVLDGVRLRSGVRSLVGYPESARIAVHPAVVERMETDPTARERGGSGLLYPQMDGRPYRPKNVEAYLEDGGAVRE